MRRACVRMRSSRDFTSRSVPSATPIRVSSPISRLRLAASARARAVSMRAAASRYPARTATSSCRTPTGWRTNPESSSAGISAGRSDSPLRPRATIAPPASTKARSTSSGNAERLSESSTKTLGRSSTARSRGRRAWRASIWARSSACPTLAGSHAEVCSSRYLMAWSPCARSTRPSGGLDALQALLRLGVLREHGQRLLVHLHRLVPLPAVLIQQRLGVEGQGLRRHLAAHPLVGGLLRQRRQVGVLHEAPRHVADQIEQVVPLHAVGFHLDDLARFDVDHASVEAEVAVEIDERTRDHVARADELPHFGRGFRRHLARSAQVLLRDELLDPLPLYHPGRGIRGQLGNHHAGDPLLERLEVLLVLTVRAAVVERQHGDARPRVLAAALGGEPDPRGCQQHDGHDDDERTRTHMMSSRIRVDHRVRVIPSCAATTSAGNPFTRAWRRAAATRPSMSSSPCSGSWWNKTRRGTPASPARATASSNVEWPQPRCSSSSSGVYIASSI